jgi:hypothetical protein
VAYSGPSEVSLIQFRSFEESLALFVALVVAVIAYKFFRVSLISSVLIGVLSAVAVAYITFFEFKLEDNVIAFRNRFRETSFPVAWVEKVSMETFWAGLPGHTVMFLMRSPPSPVNGHFMRTGLVSWPSASAWIDGVNAAIRHRDGQTAH